LHDTRAIRRDSERVCESERERKWVSERATECVVRERESNLSIHSGRPSYQFPLHARRLTYRATPLAAIERAASNISSGMSDFHQSTAPGPSSQFPASDIEINVGFRLFHHNFTFSENSNICFLVC